MSKKITFFNKKAIEAMSFKEFKAVYGNILGSKIDLKAVFVENGGILRRK